MPNYYAEDISRIIQQAKELHIELTAQDAENLWSDYSELSAAGWLVLPKRDVDLQAIIKSQLKSNPQYAAKVITLCGSTKFEKEFMDTQRDLTLKGYVVLSVGVFGHSRDSEYWKSLPKNEQSKLKTALDILHERKIDMADEIMVINKNGYIGTSTQHEIEYALSQNKPIHYLEPM